MENRSGQSQYSLVLELLHYLLYLLRHGQTYPSGVFDDGDAFVADVEEDNRRAKDAPAAYHMNIEDVRHANKGENEHLLADALEANGARQVSLHDCAEDSHHIVRKMPYRVAQKESMYLFH